MGTLIFSNPWGILAVQRRGRTGSWRARYSMQWSFNLKANILQQYVFRGRISPDTRPASYWVNYDEQGRPCSVAPTYNRILTNLPLTLFCHFINALHSRCLSVSNFPCGINGTGLPLWFQSKSVLTHSSCPEGNLHSLRLLERRSYDFKGTRISIIWDMLALIDDQHLVSKVCDLKWSLDSSVVIILFMFYL